MHGVLSGLSIAVGALAIVGTLLWCVAGAGIYGSPLAHVSRQEILQLFVLLLAGPLSLLPAGLVSRKRPVTAGLWLTAGAVLVFFWHLCFIMHEGFDQFLRLTFEAWLPLALICGPALLFGLGFLWVGKGRLREELRSPQFRRGAALVLGPLAVAGAAWGGYELWTRPVWTLTVTPEGGSAESLGFSPKEPYVREAEMYRLFEPLFAKPAGPNGRTLLGAYTLTGAPGPGATAATRAHTLVAERTRKGWQRVLRDGSPIGEERMDFAVSDHVRRILTREIADSASRNFPFR